MANILAPRSDLDLVSMVDIVPQVGAKRIHIGEGLRPTALQSLADALSNLEVEIIDEL